MTRWSCGVVVAISLTMGACATRLPVVTDPTYPDYLFPSVPAHYADSAPARGHEAAWTYLQAGDLAAAELRYDALLEETPDFYPAEAGLGWLHIAQDNFESAAEFFSRARTADPAYVSALVGYGEAMLALGRSEDALEAFEAALVADPRLSRLQRSVEELRFTIVSDQLATARSAVAAARLADAAAAYERVIAASPDSGFLHVELGRVEQQRGDLASALRHAREAATLDPEDPEAWLLEGDIHEGDGDLEAALAAYERADALDPSDLTAEHVDRVRNLLFLAGLPPEVGEIPAKESISRGDLAVLVGLRFDEILADMADRPVIITDTREHWGSEWIQTVADAGIMDVDAAYRFDPSGPVRRGELADVVVALLELLEGDVEDDLGSRSFSDMSPSHLSYDAARLAVAMGVLDALENDTFQPSRLVSGAEASDAINRLAELTLDSR